MIAEQILKYLENEGYGTEGTDLFYDFMPDSPDKCIVLYDENVPTVSESNALSVDTTGVQITVRSASTNTAKTTSWNIHKLLVGLGGNDFRFTSTGNKISCVNIETSPASIGKDNNGRAEYSAHYNIRFMSENDSNRI